MVADGLDDAAGSTVVRLERTELPPHGRDLVKRLVVNLLPCLLVQPIRSDQLNHSNRMGPWCCELHQIQGEQADIMPNYSNRMCVVNYMYIKYR